MKQLEEALNMTLQELRKHPDPAVQQLAEDIVSYIYVQHEQEIKLHRVGEKF